MPRIDSASCFARHEESRAVFQRTLAIGIDLLFFFEESDPQTGQILGNFPQALTPLSRIAAAVARDDGCPIEN